MIRSTIARRLLAGVLLFGACGPAAAAGLSTTLTDDRDKTTGTDANPFVTRPPVGGPNATVNQGTAGSGTSPWFVQLYLSGAAISTSNPFPVLTTNGALEAGGNLAALLARTPVLGPNTRANAQPITRATDDPAWPFTTSGEACTGSVVTGTSGQIVAPGTYKSIDFMNVGAADFTKGYGTTPPAVGQGLIYAASASGKQGGSESYRGPNVPNQGFTFAAASSATIAVEVCQ